jgi:hypothetical protein
MLRLQTIIEIAEDKILADLCISYYHETDPIKKQEIFDEIQKWYKKINNKE